MTRGLRYAVAAAVALAAATCSDPAELPGPETDSAASANPGAEALQQVICADDGRCWRKLAADGLHNPANAALDFLQEPATALRTLPPGGPSGNKIDWVEALRGNYIAPRTNIYPETKVRVLDLDIVFTDTKGQPHVVFPHRQALPPGPLASLPRCSWHRHMRTTTRQRGPPPARHPSSRRARS